MPTIAGAGSLQPDQDVNWMTGQEVMFLPFGGDGWQTAFGEEIRFKQLSVAREKA